MKTSNLDRAIAKLEALFATDGWQAELKTPNGVTEWVGPYVHGALDILKGIRTELDRSHKANMHAASSAWGQEGGAS